MPATLHWFKWEAGFTWISGILLLVLVYYLGAGIYLIDPGVADISPGAAIAIGLAALAGSWLVYDLLWAALGRTRPMAAALVSLALLVAFAFGLSLVFSGRGAYMHVGATLGTIMAANVWMRIIPSQRALVVARAAGAEPDAALGVRAKQRSVHNNYMTLPVVFVMLSSHYPSTYGHPLGWLVLILLFLVGAGVRHHFNLRNQGDERTGLWYVGAAVLATVAAMVATAPDRGRGAGVEPVAFADARAVIQARCVTCHSGRPTDENFETAPKDVKFDTPEQIRAAAPRIRATTVQSQIMPLGNVTEMSDEERALIARWIDGGARIE